MITKKQDNSFHGYAGFFNKKTAAPAQTAVRLGLYVKSEYFYIFHWILYYLSKYKRNAISK